MALVDRQQLGGCSAEVAELSRSSHLLLKYSRIAAGVGVLVRSEAGGLCRQPASQKARKKESKSEASIFLALC